MPSCSCPTAIYDDYPNLSRSKHFLHSWFLTPPSANLLSLACGQASRQVKTHTEQDSMDNRVHQQVGRNMEIPLVMGQNMFTCP